MTMVDGRVAGLGGGTRHVPFPWRVLVAVLLVQLALQSYFFPVGELLTPTRLTHIDAAFHTYQIHVAEALCAQHRLVGYDPFFAGGHLAGVTFNASAKVPALLACVGGTLVGPEVAYKLFSFTMGVLAPGAIVVAAAMVGIEGTAVALAGLLALLTWWTGPVRWYHTAGLVSFVAFAYWVVPFTVLAGGLLERLRPRALAVLALLAAGGVLLHPLFAVAAVLLLAPWAAAAVTRPGGALRIGLVALACVACVVLVNGGWLWASFSAPSFATIPQPYQRIVDPLLVLREPLGMAATASNGSRLYLALCAGMLGCLALPRSPLRSRLLTLLAGWAVLMTWASLGATVPAIGALQPNRFSVLAWLVLIIPASQGLLAMASAVRAAGPVLQRGLCMAGLLAAGAVVVFYLRETGLEVFSANKNRYGVTRPEVKPVGAMSVALQNFLRTQTDGSARVLFETSLARVHDQAHLAGLYALDAQREFIGGPYPFTDFASAWDDFAFGARLSDRPGAELRELLDAYNVSWVLCHSAGCKAAMASQTETRPVAEFGVVTAYRRTRAASFSFNGDAQVLRRCINRVDIRASGASELILKYHWTEGLTIDPPATISHRTVVPGARPFIVVQNAPAEFTLSVGPAPQACDHQPP